MPVYTMYFSSISWDPIYKEMYDCKWDPTTLTNNELYTPELKFL